MWYDIQKSAIIFVSKRLSEIDAGTEKGQFCLGYGHKTIMEQMLLRY